MVNTSKEKIYVECAEQSLQAVIDNNLITYIENDSKRELIETYNDYEDLNNDLLIEEYLNKSGEIVDLVIKNIDKDISVIVYNGDNLQSLVVERDYTCLSRFAKSLLDIDISRKNSVMSSYFIIKKEDYDRLEKMERVIIKVQ